MADSTFSDLDAYVAFPRLSGLTVNPAGTRLVTTVQTLNAQKNGYLTSLWEIDPDGHQPARRITHSAQGESNPAFNSSGDLYFTSSRPSAEHADQSGQQPTDQKSDQTNDSALWRLPATGGEAHLVNRRPGGVESVVTAQQTDMVAVTAPLLPGATDEDSHRELYQARQEGFVQAILHDAYPVRYWDQDLGPARPSLFRLDAVEAVGTEQTQPTQTKFINLLEGIDARLVTEEVHLSPDGSFALCGVRLVEARADARTAIGRVDLSTGAWEIFVQDPDHNYTPSIISPDGHHAVVSVANRPTPQRAMRPVLHLLDLATGELSPLTEDTDLWLTATSWLPDGSGFLALADHNGRGPIFRVDLDHSTPTVTAQTTQLTHDDATYTEALVAPSGNVAYGLRSSVSFPAEVVRIDLATGEATRLLNPTERLVLPGRLEDVDTTAEDGVRVRGWLALPDRASVDAPAPLLLWIHGGPLASWNDWSWRWNPWLAVEQGYAVLLPDPALSTGYGQDFIQRGWNSWGHKPYTDLMALTDAVEDRPDINHHRTAAMGGSFGGYMANWVAGHTDRFNAIVTHASLWALDQFGPTTDMSPFWRRQLDAEMEAQHSPHHHVANIVTPMLVIHGDQDYRVPIGEGLRLWYELLEKSGLPMDAEGKTAHRFLYFPDENHWILKPQHVKIWYQVIFTFLAQHLLGEGTPLPKELGLTPHLES
ncbi:S9 family peptidase [Auritidibacter ignavus]|uniref:S9 family peptidase n=1 Tax=Auritidibacter ignavus TaxID=678932 RepID=UPI0021055CB0|nr:prolyl oligopeptidase family serine peptidase [Auritidibacter ignavus]